MKIGANQCVGVGAPPTPENPPARVLLYSKKRRPLETAKPSQQISRVPQHGGCALGLDMVDHPRPCTDNVRLPFTSSVTATATITATATATATYILQAPGGVRSCCWLVSHIRPYLEKHA